MLHNGYQLQPHKTQHQNTMCSIYYHPLKVSLSFREHHRAVNIQARKKLYRRPPINKLITKILNFTPERGVMELYKV